ncbi:trypsin-1-like [Neocloeon triangulifer]|uniref:trypsin-1-like n=1 Tax=Neocloeon triangulifer TaxID=2078957 RepID=UPI00286F76E2|nr:trypsin-1-like [Neocloeon triangulifer]
METTAALAIPLFYLISNLIQASCQPDLINYFPYLASIQLHGRHACSGALISENWLLTAAHCVEGQLEPWLSIRLGSSSQYKSGQVSKVEIIQLHPRYNPLNLDCNIALLKMESKNVTENSTIQPIKLGSFQRLGEWKIKPQIPMLAVGWPPDAILSTSRFHSFGQKLRALGVHSVDQGYCDEEYLPFGGLTNRMFCVKTSIPTESLCNGDGGAPLIIDNRLVGLISHSQGCLLSRVPTVATKVPYFSNWIRSVTGKS